MCSKRILGILNKLCYNNLGDIMSYDEYNDLAIKAQNTGIYHIFVFDMMNSKEMDGNTRKENQIKTINLMNQIYNHIKNLEIKRNSKILVTFENRDGFGLKDEPFIFGDTFGFTIYRDTLSYEEVINIFNYYKNLSNINIDFHIEHGYYETNDYTEGNTLYFRGYAISLLSNLHKKENRIIKTLLKRK